MGIRNYLSGIITYGVLALALGCGSDKKAETLVDISDSCLDGSRDFAVVQNLAYGTAPDEFCFNYLDDVLENLASCITSENMDGSSYVCRATKSGIGITLQEFISICSENIRAPVKHVDNGVKYQCAKFEEVDE